MRKNTQPDSERHSSDTLSNTGFEQLEPRLLLSGSLSAEFVWVDNTDTLTGYTTADLQVTTDSDWHSAALLLELTQGSIYQDPVGGATSPNPALFDTFPTLVYDTYVAADGNTAVIAGGAGDVYGDVYQFDTVELDVSWFSTATDEIGTINLGRITLSDDAVGTWSLKLRNDAGETFFSLDNAFTDGELASPPPPVDQAVDGDFTGDGKADIFWHNTRNGRNAVWEMDDAAFVVETAVKRLRNSNWKLVGTGDFTGDGKNDLLWRNNADGRNTIWEMDHTSFLSAIPTQTLGNLKWRVAGVGDFTGDGQDDILWRNTQDGRNIAWEMDGVNVVTGVALSTLDNQKWQAAGVSDFTGDGKDDIFWRNTVNGRNTIWEMDGSTMTSAIRFKRLKNTAWQVAVLADYTGDNITDILWRNTSTGANTVWELNHTSLVGAVSLPNEPDLDNQPAGPMLGLWEG